MSVLDARAAVKSAYIMTSNLLRDISPKGRETARKRAEVEAQLDALARSSGQRFEGTVLVDGLWDNPNYWLRYSLLRAALGLAHGREVGVLGQFRRRHVRGSFDRFGIREVHDLHAMSAPEDCRAVATSLVASLTCAEDMLCWNLPESVHPAIVYDGVLKRQRRETVDFAHPSLIAHVEEALTALARNRALLDRAKPDLIVLSHPFNFTWGSLASIALARGIPVVLVFGLFGVLRFARLTAPDDLFRFYDRPRREEIESLFPAQASAMAEAGRAYLEGRLVGRADDLASVYAFQRPSRHATRTEICAQFEWDVAKPIVGFYASNWFDWPHQLGMTQFRDFLDWTEASFAAARGNNRVNWLFKAHPAEEWFGGSSLARILTRFENPRHIAIADKRWNNTAVLQAVDALVTYHGTAGIEFAALGKPVLVPDRGKYEDCGFVKVAQSRADYLDLLTTDWWVDMDLYEVKRRAEIFAGWWFCAPEWQGDFILPDDSKQDQLYDLIPGLLNNYGVAVARELDELREWWKDEHPYYHTSKMRRAERYATTNIK